MKYPKYYLLFFSILISTQLNAQDCEVATSQVELNANDVKANFFPSGSWWWDGSDGKYIYPSVAEGSGLPEVSAIFAGGLWVGGKDEAGNLKLAAARYGAAHIDPKSDYFPGPLDENGTTTANSCTNFDRFFGMKKQEIDAHINDFQNDGIINEIVSNSILGWPALGNPHFFEVHSFELPNNSSPLAPFVDTNANGIYDPMQGDYPNTKLADQAYWWVFNDNGGPHTESGGDPLGFEFQMMAYAYNSADPAINDATYYDLKMINKSGENLTDVYASIWLDPDLGCSEDDYIGCIPEENIGYVYNESNTDGYNCNCNGLPTYCKEIPIVGVKLLKGMTTIENGNEEDLGMSSFMYYVHGGLCDPTSGAMYWPSIPVHYYNLMQAHWSDGTPLTYGGAGFTYDDGEPTNYCFPDSPDNPEGWSMCTVFPGGCYRNMLINSGPINMNAKSIQQLSFAVIAQPNVPHPCPDISGLIEIGNTVQEVFEDPTSTSNIIYNNNLLTIQPNPFSEQTTITFKESSEQIQSLNLYAIDGKLVRNYHNINTNSLTINRADLRSGMYVYSLIATNGQVMSGKIVVE